MAKQSRRIDLGSEQDRSIPEPLKPSPPAEFPLDTIGQELSKARQRKGKRLSDVWLVLKIRPDYLVAIEEGRFDVLPGRVYALGYVRSYAEHLGLDAERLVDRLRTELAGPRTAPSLEHDPLPLIERTVRMPHSGRVMAGLIAVTFLYFSYYAMSSNRPVEPPVLPVPTRLAVEAGLTETPIPIVARAPIEQSAPSEPVLAVPADVAVTPQVPAPAIVLEPGQRVQVQLPTGKRYGTRNRNSRITLRAHRPTHVAVQGARNRTFIDRVLWPGDTYRVPNSVGLRLSSPDAGAVELILDGASLGFAGKDGAIAKNLSLNPQSVVDRRQRG
jgi:cytoskeleton protein RodZ